MDVLCLICLILLFIVAGSICFPVMWDTDMSARTLSNQRHKHFKKSQEKFLDVIPDQLLDRNNNV